MNVYPRALMLSAAGAMLFGQGCISPLDQLESAIEVEQSVRARWALHDDASTAGDATHQANHGTTTTQPAEAIEITEKSSLDASLRYAALHNADLEAAYHRWQAALEKIPQVTALPDPRVSYGYFLDEVETRVGPQQHRASVSQMFPWFGKLELRGSVQAQAARAAFERFQHARLKLFQRVKTAYYELYDLRAEIELTRENVRLLEQFEQIARTRYKVAAASHPDVIRAQVELGTLRDRLRELEARRHPLAARFNAALNRPADAPAPWPDDMPDHVTEVDVDALMKRVKQHNPQLAELDHEVEKHRFGAQLARKAAFPDITTSVDYIVTDEAVNSDLSESGDDPVILGLSINLPIWREKYEAGVRESLRQRLAATSQRAETENQLVAQLQQGIFMYRDAQRKASLYRDNLLPKARQSLQSSMAGYQAADVSFLDLLDAERMLLDLELAERRARADAGIALATIEMLIGGELDENSHQPADNVEKQ